MAKNIRGGTHLVTGGAGALGRAFAGWLLGHGAARVVLCGRRDADDAVRAVLGNIRAANGGGASGTIEYRRCDVADGGAVRVLISSLAGGPPLRGVFHAAGTLADGAATEKDWPGVWAALAAKAQGAWNLHEATLSLQSPLEFFVMFSSASALLGSAGQTAYASANAVLDHIARRRRLAGLPALAVQWGPWAGGGMAEGAGRGDRLARFGMDGLQPEDALFGFERALSAERGDGVVSVMHIDWKAYFAQWLGGSRPARFGGVLPEDDGVTLGQSGLMERLAAVPRESWLDVIAVWLDEATRHLLGRHEKLDPDQPLLEQGFDSLMAIEWRNHLAKELDRPIPSSFLFDYPTLASVADALLENIAGEKPKATGAEKRAGAAAAAAAGTSELLTELNELLGTS